MLAPTVYTKGPTRGSLQLCGQRLNWWPAAQRVCASGHAMSAPSFGGFALAVPPPPLLSMHDEVPAAAAAAAGAAGDDPVRVPEANRPPTTGTGGRGDERVRRRPACMHA